MAQFLEKGGKFVARLRVDTEQRYVGIFDSAEEAARRHDELAKKLLFPNSYVPGANGSEIVAARGSAVESCKQGSI